LETQLHRLRRGALIIGTDDRDPPLYLLREGFIVRSHILTGNQAIVDILLPGDIAGLDLIVSGRPMGEFTTAAVVAYQTLPAQSVRHLMTRRSPRTFYRSSPKPIGGYSDWRRR
jgi:CRP-like cAMP-binding protein